MPGITDPAEEYFKDGLWGWVTSTWKKLIADAAGHLLVSFAAQTIDVEVTQTTPADLTPGIQGWDGSQWRKLPLLWGYTDRYAEQQSNTSAAAGYNWLTFSTVPAGQVWVVTALSWVDVNTACTLIVFSLYDGALLYTICADPAPSANLYRSVACNVVLRAGDCLKILFGGCALNDDIYAWALGYKMAVG